MSIIHVSTEEARELASRTLNLAEELNSLILSQDNIINDELPPVLEGQTAQSFIDQYDHLRPSLVASYDMLVNVAGQLNSIVTGFEDRDQNMSAQVNQ